MKRLNKTLALTIMCLLVAFSSVFVACDDDNAPDTNQMKGGVSLNAAQLLVTRGGYMQFKGSGLNQIETIVFPENISVSDIEAVDNYTIRCLVPEDAVVGKVKLLYGDKTIETGTIAFTEPITFESFTPASVIPGDELTIKGTYLNYIDHVMFATGEAVAVTPTRYEIKVIVPVDASTGKVYLAMNVIEGTDTLVNQLPSKEELVVAQPTGITLPATGVKAGSTISITGSLLRLVKFVRFQNADDVNVAQADPTEDIAALSVVVPVNAKTGAVTLVLLSGIEIAAGDITLVEPTAAIEDLKVSYGVDETVVISGTNLDLVATAAFKGGEATAIALTEGKINLKVTAAAQSGDITLTLANGNTIAVTGLVTTKPVATLPSNATPLDELSIVSTLGSRVKTVKFGNLEAEATATGDGFKVTVPLAAESGVVTLVMDNGETVAAGSIVINAFTFCAISGFASETTTVGELMQCSVVNGASLTNVLLNDADTKYLLVGTVLYVSVGVNVGDNKVTLVSGTSKVDYTVKVVAAGEVETILYNTPVELANWSKNYELNVDFSGAPADASVRIRYTKTNNEPQFKVFNGHWGNVYDGTTDANAAVIAAADYIDLPVSLFPYSDWGYSIILQGDGMIVSSISWVKDYSAAVTIFDTKTAIGNWGNILIPASAFASAKVGQVVTVVTSDVESDAQGSFKGSESGWPAIADGTEYFDITGDFTLTITSAILDKLKSGGLIVSGKNYSIVKVTLK
ncbi:MAG: hypothetical protein QM786_19535 [Breznakibacter sp.]